MEEVLHDINRTFVRLDDEEKRENNEKLKEVLDALIENFKELDVLFNAIYERRRYGGSYYQNLKVTEPNKYNIGILFKLPKLSHPQLMQSDKEGQINVQISLTEINRQDPLKPFSKLSKLVDDSNYLNVSAVNSWFESLVQRAVNDIDNVGMSKNDPAITITVNNFFGGKRFDIVLVPLFVFGKYEWPKGFRSYDSPHGFYIVPKLCSDGDVRKWRVSFEDQEMEIIKDLGKIKPAMRLIKVLRNKQVNLKPLKNYLIQTVFLWELQSSEKRSYYMNQSLASTFITFMEKLVQCLKSDKIAYFWDENLNLLENWTPDMTLNIAYRLENILDKMKKDPRNIYAYYDVPQPNNTVCNTADTGGSSLAMVDEDNDSSNMMMVGGLIAGLGALALGGFAIHKAMNNNRRND